MGQSTLISDNVLLKLLGNRSTYFKYKNAIQMKALLERSVQIVNDLEPWYDANTGKSDVDWNDYSQWFRFVRHPSMSEEESEIFGVLFERIDETENDQLAEEILKSLVERAYAGKLITLSHAVANGKGSIVEAQDLIDEYSDQVGLVDSLADDPDEITEELEELHEYLYGDLSTGLEWPIKEMNISLGPLRKCNSILVAAYVDSGKTSLVLNCARFMAKQLQPYEEVVYFANEEAGKGVKYRFIQSMIGWTSTEMDADIKGAVALYNKVFNPKQFRLFYNPTMSTRYIEEKLRHCKPGLIIIDQLHNVSGFNKLSSSNVDRYTELAKWSRRLAVKAPCLFMHQAGSECNGLKFIEMNQLYGSKVGMQGAVDAVITLGNENGAGAFQYNRGLYFPKNKLPGGKGVDKDLRKAKWEIIMDMERCRFKGTL